ncbi:Transcription intermediary factor 1-alpha [Exophiala xenobiotica]|uniref:Transcription intermediary factor 1-alpha n=1 Tax=Lithohypha guttulata TaxID=1690604 RepID=A0ABR0K8R4_9EURO|nr:Transcription intermediary factor 1-alpha [Lithohypha guttulata]KAK5319331.1 Transcription intermediary factor 1-alpha [Exophiala xenobiotica]
MAPPPNTNLYCAQCDSQIGIAQNEWEHLTSSYARPKENGITFGLGVGEKTQAVPMGSAQKAAEGCMMAEVSCKTCSTTVAQCCKSAPHSSKEYLVGQQFFKLSRIFLKDAKTSERVEPSFVDTDRASSQARPASVRSSIPPPPPPRPRAASAHETHNVPEVQQPHPPPTESLALNAMQGMSSAMPTPTPADQMRAPQCLMPSAAQPTQYGYQQQHFYYHASPAGQPRPASANGISALSSELVEQGAAIAECFQRVANLEVRVGSEATRTTATENRLASTEKKIMTHEATLGSTRTSLEQWQAVQKNQATGCTLHGETIQRQQTMIENQQEELTNVTEKLASLAKTMDELRNTMEGTRTQSLIHNTPRPDSRDFLEDLEVMVTAMREARANDHAVKVLRDENQAMRARLKSVASAMGAAGQRNEPVPEARASSEELDDLNVLGKRKRPMNRSDQQPRKISRQVFEPVAALHQDTPALPTPDSTRPESRSLEGSLAGSQLYASEHDGSNVEKETPSSDPAPRPQVLDDDDFVMIGDDGNEDVEQEHAAAASGGGGDKAGPQLPSEAAPTLTSNRESAVHSGSSAAASIHQTHGMNGPLSPMVDGQHNQLVHISRPEPSINNEWQPVPFYGSYPPTPWYSTPIHPAQYRAPFNGRASGTHFVNQPGAVPSYFGSTMFPPQQITPAYATYLTPTGQRSTLGRSDTFSGAISRGQRLEDIIQRPTRSSSVANGNPSNRADVRVTTLQPRQSNASDKQTSVHPDKTNEVANGESIDFSDEENNAPTAESVTAPYHHTKPSSTTPAGEPNRRTTGGTLISRIVRGFTLEPLERPVINEPPPVPSSKSKQDTSRRSTGSQPPSVMPEIMAAIQNLNSSAARHVARPEPVTKSPHLPAKNTTIVRNMLTAEHAKKSRLSEPVTKTSVDVVNHHTSTLTKQSTPEVRRESFNISPRSKQATDTSNVSSAYDKDVANKDGTQVPKPANRGRPRKRGRPSDHQAKETGRAPANPASADKNDDNCAVCGKGGNVLCCDGCPKVYHHRCMDPPMHPKDQLVGDWFCPRCIELRQREKAAKDTALKLQFREQVLLERNRLAQEAMDRDEAAERGRSGVTRQIQ